FLTAPSSPNPFDLLPPVTPRLAGANPFDLFQHFTSAPASPRRAAAIYAHFAEGDRDGGEEEEEDDGDEGFHPRSSYSTTASAVPFDWEERPGTPKKADPFAARPTSRSAGWRRWRLSDLLLFRSSSEGGRISKDPLPKCPPAQQPDAPLKKANAPPPTAAAKFN
uniref:Uncharacterized protein n=1 Tax=Aegilops tauschii subsp. strangulata TaxID=200361 RepID=A0A453R3T9_AEGTS